MKIMRLLLLLQLFLSTIICVTLQAQSLPNKPNIIYIMADDLGWADVGYNGATFYETPNIDALRATGMEFSSSYPGASNCMPSRSCIVSGMYITRTQMWTPGTKAKGNKEYMKFLVPRNEDDKGNGVLPSKLTMEPSVTSIAEVMNTAGYKTAHFGKWHLGPDTQGFDVSDPDGRGGPVKNYYGNIDVSESLSTATVSFIKENKDDPFFVYLCFWDVHTPLRARENVKTKYDEKLAARQWDKEWNTTYAAMIEAVDTGVGRIHEAVQTLGIAEETLIVFTADNGGASGSTFCEPLRGAKGAFYEGGIRVATCMSWPGVIEPGTVCDTPITGVDYLPSFAELGGASLPQKQPVDGKSFIPLLLGKTTLQNRSIFWHYPLYLSSAHYNKVVNVHGTNIPYWRATPCSVIRKGDWKLIQFFEDDSVKLYNLKEDIGENHNLAKANPKKATSLLKELKTWQKQTKAVIPTELNPDFNPG
jgi:arylsulfatase A-like enzyme